MSRERIEHIIAVQTAWKEGKQIEQSLKGKDEWKDMYTPFDWAVYDYRVKEIDPRIEAHRRFLMDQADVITAMQTGIYTMKQVDGMLRYLKLVMIDNACEWLEEHLEEFLQEDTVRGGSELIERFRKAMEEYHRCI